MVVIPGGDLLVGVDAEILEALLQHRRNAFDHREVVHLFRTGPVDEAELGIKHGIARGFGIGRGPGNLGFEVRQGGQQEFGQGRNCLLYTSRCV